MEFVGFYFLGGYALLLDAISSLVDLGSTMGLLLFIKIASKPPDRNHPFGHGRLEPIAGMQLAILLSCIGGSLFIQQLLEFFSGPKVSVIDPKAWIVPVVAAILLEIAYRRMIFIAEKENSPALKADAVHYRIDAINSIIATIALLTATLIPHYSNWIDRWGAMLIALLMVYLGTRAAKENFHQLMDRKPMGRFFELVKNAALKVQGVKGTEKTRIQMYGPDAHVDIDIEVDPDMSIEEGHRIAQLVRLEVQKDWPQVLDVTVHLEPFFPGDH